MRGQSNAASRSRCPSWVRSGYRGQLLESPGRVSLPSWLCENSERTSTEGNRVLPVARFPSGLAIACEDMVAGEERRSTCSSRPSVLTRPTSFVARIGLMRHLFLVHVLPDRAVGGGADRASDKQNLVARDQTQLPQQRRSLVCANNGPEQLQQDASDECLTRSPRRRGRAGRGAR